MFTRLIFGILPLILPALAVAQDTPETYRDWSVARGDAGCVAVISVGLRDADSGLLTAALLPRDDSDIPAVMTVRVPLGAALSQPLTYTYPRGAEAVGLAWQSCSDRTCLASGPVSAAELERLKQANQIFFGFQPLPGARPLIVPVSLLGVTRAWTAAQACE
ncbi:MAG: invasion associated locus B family protein [Pseudomonadota bacterium]|nr:invasion associated locus B family protein [Pseudomonadota bacterium]